MAIPAQVHSDNIGISLAHSQHLVMENNGCGFNESLFNLQQKQYFQQLMNHNMNSSHSCFFPNTLNNIGSSIENDFACQMELHRRELDQYVRLQNEKLIMVMQEYKKHHLGMMLKKIEFKASNLLRQKDAEISQMAKRAMELEGFLTKLELEKLQWQKVAQENENMVALLNNTLEKLKENCSSNNEAEDAESCCGDVDMVDKGEQSTICKRCQSWSSCMLFLPCRHLCSCKKCEAVLDCCPVCGNVKKNSIEALIF